MLLIGQLSTVYSSITAPEEALTIRLTEPVSQKNEFFEWTIVQNEDRSFTASIPATTIQTLEVELTPAAEWAEDNGALPNAPLSSKVKNVL